MPHYKLIRYSFGDYEEEIDCGPDEELLVISALSLSSCDEPYRFAYRLEAWIGDKHIGGWRFFQDGREFTGQLRDACSKIIKGNTK